jgi:hypothetical protein
LELLTDNDRRVRMGTAAQRAVSAKFKIERMIDETERIYLEETKEGVHGGKTK